MGEILSKEFFRWSELTNLIENTYLGGVGSEYRKAILSYSVFLSRLQEVISRLQEVISRFPLSQFKKMATSGSRLSVARSLPIAKFEQRRPAQVDSVKVSEVLVAMSGTVVFQLKGYVEKFGFPAGYLHADATNASQLLSRVRRLHTMLERLKALFTIFPELDSVDPSFSIDKYPTFTDYELFVTEIYNEKTVAHHHLRKKSKKSINISCDGTHPIITFCSTCKCVVFASEIENIAFGTNYYWGVRCEKGHKIQFNALTSDPAPGKFVDMRAIN